MRIVLLYGSAVKALFKRLDLIKKDFDSLQIKQYEFKEVAPQQLNLEFFSNSLFSTKRLLIINNVDPGWEADLDGGEDLTVILTSYKDLLATAKLIKSVKSSKGEVLQFSEEKEVSVFPFLDMLADKKNQAVIEFEKLYEEFGGQYLLTMMFFQLRRLMQSNSKLPPFVIKKIERQRKDFPKERVRGLYKELLEMDYKIKSGLTEERVGVSLVVQSFIN